MKKILVTGILLALLYVPIIVNAQKLPDIQNQNLRAPLNIKIDGKLNEWGNKFQAYNKATDVFYSISNDDNNLYLVVQAREPVIIKKIIASGIFFKINNTTKENYDSPDFCFPTSIPMNTRTRLALDVNKKLEISADGKPEKKEVDSLINGMNMVLGQKFKEIKIAGINAIKDTLISIYNEIGILAAAHFDDLRYYNYELAVPLKYIASVIDKDSKISYEIKINGASNNRTNIVFVEESDYMRVLNHTTNFSGSYILTK